MKDSRTILSKAAKRMVRAFQLYQNGEDTLAVAKRLLLLHRMLKKVRSALIREQLQALLTKPTLDQKDQDTIEELFGAMIQKGSRH